ncbi:MAG: hypothetical protein ACWA44_14870 [Thiotrichales bacterium]
MKPLIDLLPQQIQHKARENLTHQRLLDEALRGSPIRQARAGGISGTTLTVICKTASDASSMRYLENAVVAAFEAHCTGLITRIHVRLDRGLERESGVKEIHTSEPQQSEESERYRERLRSVLRRLEG